jgi:F-type H+-transporting ATPase subunit delta
MASAVSTRYAQALADVVTKSGSALTPQNAVAELGSFQSVLESSREFRATLLSPAIPGSRKKAAVSRIADVLGLSGITRNFLFILIDHRRIPALGEILRTFEEVLDARLGFARAEITSARELDDAQRSALNSSLERLTGKRVRARFTVNESLIGGAVARIGSTVYDGSIRAQLNSLGRQLSAEE